MPFSGKTRYNFNERIYHGLDFDCVANLKDCASWFGRRSTIPINAILSSPPFFDHTHTQARYARK